MGVCKASCNSQLGRYFIVLLVTNVMIAAGLDWHGELDGPALVPNTSLDRPVRLSPYLLKAITLSVRSLASI